MYDEWESLVPCGECGKYVWNHAQESMKLVVAVHTGQVWWSALARCRARLMFMPALMSLSFYRMVLASYCIVVYILTGTQDWSKLARSMSLHQCTSLYCYVLVELLPRIVCQRLPDISLPPRIRLPPTTPLA